MIKKTKLHERRQHARYLVRNGAVAIPRSSTANIGRIIDINYSGLAVRYIGELNWLKKASQIDIMMIDDDCYISKLPAKIISDFEYTFYASGKMQKEKRCGLQFTNLTAYQLTQIDQFIQKFIII